MVSVWDSLLSEDCAGENSWKSLPMSGIAMLSSRQGLDHQGKMVVNRLAVISLPLLFEDRK
jgi:hypothetical protein